MANIASPSTSAAMSTVEQLSPTGEINFEDLISVSVLNESTDENPKMEATLQNNDVDHEPEIPKSSPTQEPMQKLTTLTKIVPKSLPTTAKLSTLKGSNSGQVVIIQGPTGQPLPIRIAGSTSGATASTTTANKVAIAGSSTVVSPTTTNVKTIVAGSTKDSPTSKPVTIQVLKMPDGSLVQFKNNKTLNLTNFSNISQLNVGSGKPVIVKTANGQKLIGTQTKLGSSQPLLKSLTFAEAQLAGYIKKPGEGSMTKLQKILPASTSTGSTSTTTSSATAGSSTKEITIKSETDGTTKQIVVPQHMVKGSSFQAIQIPGKSGMQYVRVLTPGSSGSAAKIVTAIKKEANSPTKSPLLGTHRIVMNANGKPTLSIISSKDNSMAGKANTKVISTVPTLRRIQDAMAASKSDTTHLMPIKRISTSLSSSADPPKILNSQAPSNVAKTINPLLQQQQLRKLQLTETKSLLNRSDDSVPPRTKQYSTLKHPPLHITLKASPDPADDPIAVLLKRSPTPEALRRKHCNCTKSQCLKLYCDCFANGEFCQDCNCKECFNNLEYEDERQKAIKICLERNPNAFKPKITKAKDQSDIRLHNKGCNCKRSGCLKNYCECYEAKIACSANCKCFGCRNVEDRSERGDADDAPASQTVVGRTAGTKRPIDDSHDRPSTSSSSSAAAAAAAAANRLQQDGGGPPPNKQPYNFITQEVVDATIQCMIAQADECKRNGMSNKIAERMIIEELGRCLVEIIDFSIRNMDN